jgi:poly-gamma-glutamate capsule biosynthesis protein CapA/YwtB (metallophosphatase superfamily)
VRVIGIGDVILASKGLRQRLDPRLLDCFQKADAVFANAEFVCPARDTPSAALYEHSAVCVEPWVLDELESVGVDMVSMANNHLGDFGAQGVADTLSALEARRLVQAGAGRSLAEARAPAFLETPDLRLGMVAACSSSALEMLASAPAYGVAARPGLNPLRFTKSYVLPPDDFAALRKIDEDLGTAASRRHSSGLGLFGGYAELARTTAFRFGAVTIECGEVPAVVTVASETDMQEICGAVGDAVRRADVVVGSLHCHEGADDGWNSEYVAAFVTQAAHGMIDAGASAVFGHGPHMLRGVEFYAGRPIFYSLGNFIFDRQMIERIPAEERGRYGIPPTSLPADVHDYLSKDEQGRDRGFYGDARFWESCVAECDISDTGVSVRLAPVVIGAGGLWSARGLPRLAPPEQAAGIVARLEKLSSPYETRFSYDATSGWATASAA